MCSVDEVDMVNGMVQKETGRVNARSGLLKFELGELLKNTNTRNSDNFRFFQIFFRFFTHFKFLLGELAKNQDDQ